MTQITVKFAPDGRLRLAFPYDKGLIDRLAIFGTTRQWDKVSRVWFLEPAQFPKLVKHFGEQLAIHPDVWMGLPVEYMPKEPKRDEELEKQAAFYAKMNEHMATWQQNEIRKREMIARKKAERMAKRAEPVQRGLFK